MLVLKGIYCIFHFKIDTWCIFLGIWESLGFFLVYVFKNWKLLFENICRNMCGWKSVWQHV